MRKCYRPYEVLDVSSVTPQVLSSVSLPSFDSSSSSVLHSGFQLVGDGGLASKKALTVLSLDTFSTAELYVCRDMLHDMLVTFHPMYRDVAKEFRAWKSVIPIEFLVVETMIAQLTTLPTPPHATVYYFSLLAELGVHKEIQPAVGSMT